jgi:predicted Zn-dependent protease
MSTTEKEAMLLSILAAQPGDAFARYGLAMEYAGTGRTPEALEQFATLTREHPDYTAGYFMAAQTLARADRQPEAITQLEQGIASARRTGNTHALSEMQAMLDELEISS